MKEMCPRQDEEEPRGMHRSQEWVEEPEGCVSQSMMAREG